MTCEFKWVLTCAALALGEGCGFAVTDLSHAWPVVAAVALFAVMIGYGLDWRPWPYLAVFLLGVVLAMVAAERRLRALDELLEENAGRPTEAEFRIGGDLREERHGDGRACLTFVGEVRGIPVRVHLPAGLVADGAPRVGETWRCTGWLGRGSEGPFGRRRPFWVGGRGTSCARVETQTAGWRVRLERFRENLSRRVGIGLGHAPGTADLNRAMLLGERARIDRETRDVFVAAGTVHLFAISGLHVVVVARLLNVVLALVWVPVRWRALVLLPLVWVYVAMVGCGPSAVRAATMAVFYYGAPIFWRRPNGLTAWALAFLLTYVRDPAMAFDTGCTFSFAVMFALVLWGWATRPFVLPWYGKFGVVAVAWAAGVPIAARVFGRITPGGLLANVVTVPLAEISVTLSALGVVASGLSQGVAAHVNNFAGLATAGMEGVSGLVAARPWANREVAPWSLGDCVAWYVGLILALVVLRTLLLRRRRTL